jgi:hypothetical protein
MLGNLVTGGSEVALRSQRPLPAVMPTGTNRWTGYLTKICAGQARQRVVRVLTVSGQLHRIEWLNDPMDGVAHRFCSPYREVSLFWQRRGESRERASPKVSAHAQLRLAQVKLRVDRHAGASRVKWSSALSSVISNSPNHRQVPTWRSDSLDAKTARLASMPGISTVAKLAMVFATIQNPTPLNLWRSRQ